MPSVVEKVINSWALSTLVIILASMIITDNEASRLQAVIGIMLMHAWVYWTHRGLHMLPRDGIIGMLNTHMRFHHAPAPAKPLPRWLELLFETVTDLGMNLSLLGIQWSIGYYPVPISCIVLFSIAYTTVHLVNYSIVGSVEHKRHHVLLDKNYGPDTMDHLCGTNYDDSAEDWDLLAVNALVAFYITRSLKSQIGWKD